MIKNVCIDLDVFKSAIKSIESKVYRDFMEIRNLQNSNSINDFTNRTIYFIQNELYKFFKEKRSSYSIKIKNEKEDTVENSKYLIYINPLAGIKNYMHGIPYFCTTISLISLEQKQIMCGLVNNYATNEKFFVTRSRGAFLSDPNVLNDQRIRTSNRLDLNTSLIAIKYDSNKKIFNKIVNSNIPMFKINNCSILDSCYTACGRYDANIILEGDKMDLALSKLFVKECGGLVYQINENNSYIFSNNNILNNIQKLF